MGVRTRRIVVVGCVLAGLLAAFGSVRTFVGGGSEGRASGEVAAVESGDVATPVR